MIIHTVEFAYLPIGIITENTFAISYVTDHTITGSPSQGGSYEIIMKSFF